MKIVSLHSFQKLQVGPVEVRYKFLLGKPFLLFIPPEPGEVKTDNGPEIIKITQQKENDKDIYRMELSNGGQVTFSTTEYLAVIA